jgi:hypothetical protein
MHAWKRAGKSRLRCGDKRGFTRNPAGTPVQCLEAERFGPSGKRLEAAGIRFERKHMRAGHLLQHE